MDIVPKSGLKGLIENWQSDLIAAVSVSLVAMPLALGIALASGVPPMAGVLSAVIGGIVTTFFRGSHVAINGPAAGLIAVVLASMAALDDGSGNALNYVVAAIFVSGAIQVLLGLLKMGRFADLFHSSVIHGILAAIGVIIIAKQIHVALGTQSSSDEIIGTLVDALRQIPNINPFVAIISLAGLLLLIFQSRINYKLFHLIPAPVWLLALSIPFVYAFNFFEPHTLHLFGNEYHVGPELLINLPDNPLDSIVHPDFSKIHTLPFWTSVLSITMIASIESLAGSKAVDKLDPYKRKTDLNKDLVGIGMSTMVSGALGGLPIITVIVRSSVNVHNNAKTKWSNLYHGILLLLFIFILTPVIRQVPLCALAILLVYTGYKLASPTVFKHVYSQGVEQWIFFTGTLIITLFTDLLVGIFGGLLLALFSHFLLVMVPVNTFFKMIFDSGSNLFLNKDKSYDLQIKGVANFLATIKIEHLLERIKPGSKVTIDLTQAKLVDHSILELLYNFKRAHAETGGKVQITGLDKHISSSKHKTALKILISAPQKLTARQIRLQEMATDHNWIFASEPIDDLDYFESYQFFKSRPIETKWNTITPKTGEGNWELFDVTFEEGAMMAYEEFQTTLGLIKMPGRIPRFVIEKKDFTDRYLNMTAWHKNLDYVRYRDFSRDFTVKVGNRENMKNFLTDELRALIENGDIHHLESNGESVLIFNEDLRLARISDYSKIVRFAEAFQEACKGATFVKG